MAIALESVNVAKPCPASWEAMAGDDRMRFCSQCRLHVYNLSAMSRADAEELIQAREGRTCIRFYRRTDGTMLTQDCPVGVRAWRRRLALIGGLAAAFLIALLSVGTVFSWTSGTQGKNQASPITMFQRIRDWFFPPPPLPLMGEMAPILPLLPQENPVFPGPPPLPPDGQDPK